jgi:hypothetical protein
MYRITFIQGEPITGVSDSRKVAMPYECTSDGTAFVNIVLQPSIYSPPVEVLVAIPPSGQAHDFRLDQVTGLYDIMQKGHYASESGVVFLVIAAPEDKQAKETFQTADGENHEVTRNIADHHDYLVIFDREGNYKRKVQIDDSFAVQRVGVFPSGAFLAFGFDKTDRSPRLTMLNEDGTLRRIEAIPKNSAPPSVFGTRDGTGKPAFFPNPVQLVPNNDSIIVVQPKFPLLAVNESGAIRSITPKLPDGKQVKMLIASDANLFALINDISDGSIYELNPQDGNILRRFRIENDTPGTDVACVHDAKFLSFTQGGGRLVPLIGTAKPIPDPASVPQPESQ